MLKNWSSRQQLHNTSLYLNLSQSQIGDTKNNFQGF